MVKSAVRVLDILEAVGSRKAGLTQKDIAQVLGIPKSSLSNLLSDLSGKEYLVQRGSNGHYVLGPQLLILAGRFLDNQDVVGHGRSLAAVLTRETGESVAIAIPVGWNALILYKEDGNQAILPSIRVGTRLPLYASAVGKAILAHFPEDEIQRYLEEVNLTALTSSTIIDPQVLLEELRIIQGGGLARNRDGFRIGISALAAPIFDHGGRAVASMALSVPTERLDAQREEELGRAISLVAAKCSRLIGFSPRYNETGSDRSGSSLDPKGR